MTVRRAIVVLVVVAAAAGIWVLVWGGPRITVRLVPAWQLVPAHRYGGSDVVDPFVSWSPDSRSLLLSEYSRVARKAQIFRWNVGEKKLRSVTDGSSPNHLDDQTFIYLKTKPKAIYKRDIESGSETEVLAKVKLSNFWDEVDSFTYDPERKTVALRLAKFTRRYVPGTEEYDMTGRLLGDVSTCRGENVVDCSRDPTGSKCALVVQEAEGATASLQIADKGQHRGDTLASGSIGAVAWSTADDLVAYAESTSVLVVRPSDGAKAIVARFDAPTDKPDARYVCRLSWSPNGHYLAVLVYVSSRTGEYPLIYVLDMSSFEWDGRQSARSRNDAATGHVCIGVTIHWCGVRRDT